MRDDMSVLYLQDLAIAVHDFPYRNRKLAVQRLKGVYNNGLFVADKKGYTDLSVQTIGIAFTSIEGE